MTLSRHRMYGVLLAFFLLLSPAICAGAETYSLSFSSASGRMSWNPTFPGWSYSAPVAFSAAGDSTSMLRLNAKASLRASVFPRDGRQNLQENGRVGTTVSYPILGPKATISVSGSISSRSAALVKQKTRSQSIGFGFGYQPLVKSDGPFRSMRVNLRPGFITAGKASRANPDSTIEERGLQYNASLNMSPGWDIADKKLSTSFGLTKQDNTLKSNKNKNESMRFSTRYTFPKGVRADLSAGESRSQRGLTRRVILEEKEGDFVSRDITEQAELSETRSRNFSTTLKAEVMGFDFSAGQRWRRSKNTNTANADEDLPNPYFAKDRESERWEYDVSAKGELPGNLVGSTSVKYKTSDERRLPVTRSSGLVSRDVTGDRDDRHLFLRGLLDWQPSEDHGMTLSGSSRVIRSDNPGEPEQDRDTFNNSASLRYRGRFDSGLNLSANIASSATHRVNLHSRRSSQNQRTRNLSFSVSPSYERLETRISHTFQISARRTIFDFDRQINRSVLARRSIISRSWSMAHTLSRSIIDNLSLNVTYRYRADDRGILLVENSSQIVEEDNAAHRVRVRTRYKPSSAMSIGTTYGYVLDRKWQYLYTSSGKERDLRRRNPHRSFAINAEFNPRPETRMSARFSRARQLSGTFDSLSVLISRRV